MKKILILVVLGLFLTGCIEQKILPDVKLTSQVDIDTTDYIDQHPHYSQPYNTTWRKYDVTFAVKEINGICANIGLQLELETYNNQTGDWESWASFQFDRTSFYLDGGNEETVTLSVDDIVEDDVEKRIRVYLHLSDKNHWQVDNYVLHEELLHI